MDPPQPCAPAPEPGRRPAESCGHRLVEHTADIGLACWGPTPADLFREAARGLIEILLGEVRVSCSEKLQLDLEGGGREELLVAWLNELLFRFESEGFLPGEIDFEILDESRLRAHLRGERHDPERWPLERQVKAATYHQLQIEEQDGGWRVTIYLDL